MVPQPEANTKNSLFVKILVHANHYFRLPRGDSGNCHSLFSFPGTAQNNFADQKMQLESTTRNICEISLFYIACNVSWRKIMIVCFTLSTLRARNRQQQLPLSR